jgi:uncharacterized lipoprotein YmbA
MPNANLPQKKLWLHPTAKAIERFLCALTLSAVAACSPTVRYHALSADSAAAPVSHSVAPGPFIIDLVLIPDSINRPEIVLRRDPYRTDSSIFDGLTDPVRRKIEAGHGDVPPRSLPDKNAIEVLAQDHWKSPLPEMLLRTLDADVSARLREITPDPPPEAFPYQISVRIFEFSAAQNGQVSLDAAWGMFPRDAKITENYVFSHRAQHVSFTNGNDVNQIVGTMSKLVGRLADDIVATIVRSKTPAKRKKG